MRCSFLWLVLVLTTTNAWSPFSRGNHRASGGGGHGSSRNPWLGQGGSEDDHPFSHNWLLSGLVIGHKNEDEELSSRDLRGGASSTVKGSKNTLQTTAAYWSNAWKSATESVSNTVGGITNKVTSVFQSKEQKEQRALIQKMKTTPVRSVTAPNSTVLPPDILSVAAKRSGMIGNPLQVESVQELARNLKQWYERKGYILHSVIGATLKPESATAELQVDEPKLSKQPVGIIFLKEMVVDDDGSLVTFRQYKEKHARRKTFGYEKLDKSDLNVTYVQTTGRTDPRRIASALKMKPGRPFRWNGDRWQAIARSGIFSCILKASPQRVSDGTVQLNILATEAPPRNLEYGISKSLYTNSWEGEADFEHNNLLGGGESLGVIVRRGTKDAEPSVKLRYSDDKFGLEGGYDVELFSDYIGEKEKKGDDGEESQLDSDALLDRRGLTVRVRNPIDPATIRHTTASASVERTSTLAGYQEAIGSGTFSAGPFRKDLPMDARSNVLASVTAGTRVADIGSDGPDSPVVAYKVMPYAMASATTRQVFPFASTGGGRPISLALQHVVTTSSPDLPRHEATALGIAARVRGYDSGANGRISSSVVGSTEIRVPVRLPTDRVRQDAGIVIFGDWLFAQKNSRSSFMRKSSVGIGLRKGLQGIPVKYDISYTQDGKIRAFFGLGRDFDV